MSFAISFKTSKFDVSKEDENPINPIVGQSLLLWLKQELKGELDIDEPDSEDWGWYSDINWNNRTYMLGASACYEEGDNPTSELEWVFQVHKDRSFKEKLLGKEKMTKEDDCLLFFKSKLESEPSFNSIEFE